MKKDRNCGVPYPIYPTYQSMPYMPNMMPMQPNIAPYDSNYNIQDQINMLDKRITKLENMINQNSYSSSNYQMM